MKINPEDQKISMTQSEVDEWATRKAFDLMAEFEPDRLTKILTNKIAEIGNIFKFDEAIDPKNPPLVDKRGLTTHEGFKRQRERERIEKERKESLNEI